MYRDNYLLHHLPLASAVEASGKRALTYGATTWTYEELATQIERFAAGLSQIGAKRMDRVGIYLEKRFEFVVAAFGTSMAGCVFVPINPILKSAQIQHISNDCQVTCLITSAARFPIIENILAGCPSLQTIIVTEPGSESPRHPGKTIYPWMQMVDGSVSPLPSPPPSPSVDSDVVSILYTSGSTGKPKGVVLSHRNMVAGAKSVASYLENHSEDCLLAALPLSFDAGFSQLTTAFCAGSEAVLLNYLTPQELLNAVTRHRITGLTGVPPLWIQLCQLDWPASVTEHLRYFATTGGRMPLETLTRLRAALPKSKPFLMFGLTEAFRATYLDPAEIAARPDSIGKAIPNAEILVLRQDGGLCDIDEPGELVQRGALVAQGYWNDPEKTAMRFKPLPPGIGGGRDGLTLPEIAVYSGDSVRRDRDGFLYFIGREDEMIKTSGYRVSPTEIEEILYAVAGVQECAACGVPDAGLGQAIAVVITRSPGFDLTPDAILDDCRKLFPSYMVPHHLHIQDVALPRNPNGKIDRQALRLQMMRSVPGDFHG